jgi:hypothetical protein
MTNRKLQLIGIVMWAFLIALGMAWMGRYANMPGARGPVPAHWPAGTGLVLSRNRLSLLVFIHPQCSCTRATVEELKRLIASPAGENIDTTILAVLPYSKAAEWRASTTVDAIRNLPRLRLFYDLGGRESRHFGAFTSGYALAYSPDGNLRFAGGMTAARGETGDNTGIRVLALLAQGAKISPTSTPVFGCELRGPSGGLR